MKIKLIDREIGIAQSFALRSVDSSAGHYRSRQQFNREKITHDIFVGKASEIGVSRILREQLGLSISTPDFGVYEAKHKNYNADLTFKINEGNVVGGIHVKSQHSNSAARFGLSWCFQKTDPLILNPEKLDYLVLCVLNSPDEVEIKGILKAESAKGIYAEPVKEALRKTKTVLYYKDIHIKLLEEGVAGLAYYGKRTRSICERVLCGASGDFELQDSIG